ncbi:aminopeptidase [Cryptosporidium ryanae]|uniref:aminopeptidase n=1 Tax=Cryptosporidium ryanae TaxID=515981 RepID=UPI00351A4148|nr:aminopeptidase [Cryptosporidium ryanae]
MIELSKIEKLEKVRCVMEEYGLDAYIIHTSDPHMSEYMPLKYMRREFMTEFYGSQGTCLVTKTDAHLIVDGRYIVEAKKTATPEYEVHLIKRGFFYDIVEILNVSGFNGVLGVDTDVISWFAFVALNNYVETFGLDKRSKFKIKLLNTNIVDKIRPMSDVGVDNGNNIYVHDIKYTGETSRSKIAKLLSLMKDKSARLLYISNLTEISWILNLRGSDIEFTPVFLSFLLIEIIGDFEFLEADDIQFRIKLFVDTEKISDCKEKLFEEFSDRITIFSIDCIYQELENSIKNIYSNNEKDKDKIWLPQESSNIEIMMTLFKGLNSKENEDVLGCSKELIKFVNENNILIKSESPVVLLRGVKNEVELNGMRECHILDGLALSKFLHYLDKSSKDGSLFNNGLTEWDLAQKLLEFRKEQNGFVYPSFATISSMGANGAIIHYRPDEFKSSRIKPGMYLCDSGGQYYTGTTDVTRSLFLFGRNGEKPSYKQIEIYTRVLIGFIRLHRAIFPEGINGLGIDALARSSLWEVGLDYLHGTGHGVGSFLSVHEGPWSISCRGGSAKDIPNLEKGAVVSIEPGYYEEGEFGVRIENLVEIVEAEIDSEYKKLGNYLAFSPLTYVPIQKNLIDIKLLSNEELDWLNWYHERTLEKLERVASNDSEFLSWLVDSCSPIQRDASLPLPKTLYQ